MKHATGSYWRIFVLAVSLGLLGLCACMAEDVVETEVKIWVGPDGGSVLGPRGTRLIIPQGAVSDLVQISMIQVNERIVPELAGAERLSIGLVARPDDFAFDKPVTVLLPYDPTGLSASDQKEMLSIYRAPEWSEAWENLGGTVNVDTNEIRTQTRRLGVFAIFSADAEVSDGDGDLTDGDLDAETETSDEPENCSCREWEGVHCRADLSVCSGVFSIEMAAIDAGCESEVTVIDDDQELLANFTMKSCGTASTPTITTATGGDCKLYLDAYSGNIALNCHPCYEVFTTEACNFWNGPDNGEQE